MSLSYIQKGEGRDLVMLHGYLASKESFFPEIEYFSRFYRVTALDFLGMGGADALTEPFSVGDYAAWTKDALAALGVRQPYLIAHSFGGRVALKLLARGPFFEKSVLVGCAGIAKRHGPVYSMKVGAYRAIRKIAPAFAEAHFGSSDYRGLSPVMKESFKRIVGEDLRRDAEKIVSPVLFLCGDRDRETPLSSVKILHRAVKHSELLVLHGAGHFAYLDDPPSFRLAAEDFFDDLT